MNNVLIKKVGNIIEYFLLIILIISFWFVMDAGGKLNPVIMPSPSKIFHTFIKLLSNGSLLQNALVSLFRVLKGYVLASVCGIVLGILIGLSRHLDRLTQLLVQILKPIPPIAWIPLVILWFGIGESGKIFHVIGKEMTVDEVLHEALKDKAFFDTSGGGITLSGGEPLMQGDFAVSILEKAKEQNIHTTIETCGCVPWETFDRAASFLDYLIMDVKCFDEKKHVQNTGGSNRQILENLSRVRSKYPFLKIKVRTPVIPEVNDSEEEIGRIVDFIKTKAVEYELLKYHKLGLPKYESLGRDYPMGDVELSEERFSELKRFAFERMHHEFVQGEGI